MAFCPSCGAPAEGRFCQKCGATVEAAPPSSNQAYSAGPAPAATSGMTDNVAGALCYLFTVITGILFLVLEPYNRNKNIRFHAFQAIFFGISTVVMWVILLVISAVLHVIPVVGALISLLLMFVLWIGVLVVWLMLMFKTFNNQRMVLPIIGPLAEKQS
jgi:uncharacterized membrane protein